MKAICFIILFMLAYSDGRARESSGGSAAEKVRSILRNILKTAQHNNGKFTRELPDGKVQEIIYSKEEFEIIGLLIDNTTSAEKCSEHVVKNLRRKLHRSDLPIAGKDPLKFNRYRGVEPTFCYALYVLKGSTDGYLEYLNLFRTTRHLWFVEELYGEAMAKDPKFLNVYIQYVLTEMNVRKTNRYHNIEEHSINTEFHEQVKRVAAHFRDKPSFQRLIMSYPFEVDSYIRYYSSRFPKLSPSLDLYLRDYFDWVLPENKEEFLKSVEKTYGKGMLKLLENK